MKGNKHSDKLSNPELADEENPGITPEELRRVRPAPGMDPSFSGTRPLKNWARSVPARDSHAYLEVGHLWKLRFWICATG
jgi:hypothetical protein